MGGNPVGFVDPSGLCTCSKIEQTALGFKDAEGLGDENLKDSCHVAVAKVLKQAGANAPDRYPYWPGSYPLGAGTKEGGWGHPNEAIEGWQTVSGPPRPGDVVSADGGSGGNPIGQHHLGIVVTLPGGGMGSMSLNSASGQFRQSRWPFNQRFPQPRPGSAPNIPQVFWRCTCNK